MLQFIKKTLARLDKLDLEHIRSIILDLHRDQQRLAEVVNSLPDGIVVLDERHCPLLQNRAARLLLPLREHSGTGGGERGAVVAVWDAVDDAQIAHYLQQALEGISGQRNASASFSFGAAGNLRTLQLELLPLVRQGRVVGNILRIIDITEKINNESRLHRAEQMASLTHLTANVAHEIKNPLAAISIYIQLIKRKLEPHSTAADSVTTDSTATINDHLKIIEEEIARLNNTVVNFLFSVRPMELTLEEVKLHPLLDEMVVLFQPELQDAQISLTTRYQNNLPTVEIDAAYIKQAFVNIIKNAIESIALDPQRDNQQNDGVIEIRTTTAKTSTNSGGVQVEVIDTGGGVGEAELGRIFDPYFTTKDEGSGIGLTQTDKIIREHRGEITLKNNTTGKGATVTVILPRPRTRQKLIGEECANRTNS